MFILCIRINDQSINNKLRLRDIYTYLQFSTVFNLHILTDAYNNHTYLHDQSITDAYIYYIGAHSDMVAYKVCQLTGDIVMLFFLDFAFVYITCNLGYIDPLKHDITGFPCLQIASHFILTLFLGQYQCYPSKSNWREFLIKY